MTAKTLLLRVVQIALVALAATYLLFLLAAIFVSDTLLFHPRRVPRGAADEIRLRTADGVEIAAVFLPNPFARFTLLYSHGNGEILRDLGGVFEQLQRRGLAVFAYDYHGYGTSGGQPSERNCYMDEDAAYEYLTTTLHVPPDRIIAYGRSLGGAMAIDLASRKPVAGVIAESSFTSAFRVLTQVSILPFDRFRSIDKIGRICCPILVTHGTQDPVIPFRHGKKLFARANEPKISLWVDGAGHNDVQMIAGKQYEETLERFFEMVEKSGSR